MCEHVTVKSGLPNCPACVADRTIRMLEDKRITERLAWQVMFILCGRKVSSPQVID